MAGVLGLQEGAEAAPAPATGGVQFALEQNEHVEATEVTPLLEVRTVDFPQEDMKQKVRNSRSASKGMASLDVRRAVHNDSRNPQTLLIRESNQASTLSKGVGWRPKVLNWRSLIPSSTAARRAMAIVSSKGMPPDPTPPPKGPRLPFMINTREEKREEDPELPKRGESLKQLRPRTCIRDPRARPVPWVERVQHVNEVRAAQMEVGSSAEGPMLSLPKTHPGFLSSAHLRSDAYWRDLMGGDNDEEGPFPFVATDECAKCCAFLIISFALILGRDDGQGESGEALWEKAAVGVILGLSLMELLMQFANYNRGVSFKKPEDKMIMTVDLVVVLGCSLEVCFVHFLSGGGLHLSRLLWLCRFLRILSMIPSLRELTLGVIDAMQGLFWVVVFLFIFTYALAVVLTRIIGHASVMGPISESDADVREVREMFSNVYSSMFYLFQTTSQWSLVPLLPLLNASPWCRFGFTLIYIYIGWVLVAVMTGTVSFTMISFKARMLSVDEIREDEKRMFVNEVLVEIFGELDKDGSGELDHEEFKSMLRSKELMHLLATNTDIKLQDLEDMWMWLDADNSGTVTMAEFFDGFEMLNEPFRQRTLLRLQEKVSREIKDSKRHLEERVENAFDTIAGTINTPLLKIHAILEQVQVLMLTAQSLTSEVGLVSELEDEVTRVMSDGGTHYTLEGIESRLDGQIAEALERLDRFQGKPAPPAAAGLMQQMGL